MALILLGNDVTDIRGSYSGIYFTRDKSGLHIATKPRKIRRRTTAQHRVRSAFTRARAFSTINRTVSYNMYRLMTGLEPAEPPIDYPPVK